MYAMKNDEQQRYEENRFVAIVVVGIQKWQKVFQRKFNGRQ